MGKIRSWACLFLSSFLLACSNESHHEIPSSLSCDLDTNRDGEACVVFSKTDFTAGTLDTFTVTVIAGKNGIRSGGGVAIGMHHGSAWRFQNKNRRLSNFVSVKSSPGVEAVATVRKQVPAGMFENQQGVKFPNQIFPTLIIATLGKKELRHNEFVSFKFGANSKHLEIQNYEDLDHEIRITSDNNADGIFDRTEESFFISVKSGAATQYSATLPSQIKKDEPVEVLIRAEDEYYNIDPNYSGTVAILDESGEKLASDLNFDNGLVRTKITLDRTGPHRLKLLSDGQEWGRSNPLKVFETMPRLRKYWGDMHGHSGDSDGLGRSLDEYFSFGRDIAGLDVIALTDHGHPNWRGNIAAVRKYNAPGEFVTILAQEAGAKTDHLNIYLRRDNLKHISAWQNSYKGFQEWVDKQYNQDDNNALIGPHHFGYFRNPKSPATTGDPDYPFDYWNEKVARFVEVYSSHGTSEFRGNPRPLSAEGDESKFMQYGLTAGRKFAVIGASDNHDSRPGRSIWGNYPNGLAAFLSEDLSRDSIWDSFWNKRTYGTSFDRIYMDFTLNGRQMGEQLNSDSAVELKGYIIGKTDSVEVSIIRDNVDIHSESTTNGVIDFTFMDNPEPGEHFYYIRVTQDNGERAWSTPIWVSQQGE